jgi:inhibitor of cysteine peptidase
MIAALRGLLLGFSVLTFLALYDLAPCGANGDGKTVTVTEKDNGATIKLSKADRLVVRLEVQGGTGFTWKIAKIDEAVLKPMGKPDVEKPEKPKPGGKVVHIYRFTVEKAGTSNLEMHYARPFEKDKAPAKTFKLKVDGSPAP